MYSNFKEGSKSLTNIYTGIDKFFYATQQVNPMINSCYFGALEIKDLGLSYS